MIKVKAGIICYWAPGQPKIEILKKGILGINGNIFTLGEKENIIDVYLKKERSSQWEYFLIGIILDKKTMKVIYIDRYEKTFLGFDIFRMEECA